MRALDTDRLHECGDVVGKQLGRVWPGRLVAFAGAAWIERNAGEVLGIVADLEGVASVVRGEIRGKHKRRSAALLLVVHRDVIDFDLGHAFVPPIVSSSRAGIAVAGYQMG